MELRRRSEFLQNTQADKWNGFIEDILPTWLAVLRVNPMSGLLELEKCNRQFRDNFHIACDYDFRKLLR
jgi:bifunctional pyridoxal-dependent enzyme with beta-cystathionase and maltose regulon repressor activities